MKGYKFILTEKDFVKNWENSSLLKNTRYVRLLWVDGKLHTEYKALYLGENIKILTY